MDSHPNDSPPNETTSLRGIHSEKVPLLSKRSDQNKDPSFIYYFFLSLYSIVVQTLLEMKKRKISYLLGVASCVIVVWMTMISFSSLSQIPLVFLRLAEVRNGEFDLALSPGRYMSGSTLNYTLVAQNMPVEPDFQFHTPRFIEDVVFYNFANCTGIQVDDGDRNVTDPSRWKWMYQGRYGNATCDNSNCVAKFCSNSIRGTLNVINTLKERAMGFGREYHHGAIPKGEAFISAGLSEALGVSIGDVIIFPIKNVLGVFQHVVQSESLVLIPLKVSKILHDPLGKYSSEDRMTILTEFDEFVPYWANFIHPKWDRIRSQISKVDLNFYTSDIYVNLNNRLDQYNEQDYDVIQNKLVKFSSRVMYFLGFNQLDSHFPILVLLFQTRFISLFLGLIITIIITILSILAVILIYSLLLINVETKTFEFGVLRMLGMTKKRLIASVLMSSFSYALPGWIVGLIVGQLSYLGISSLLGLYLELKLSLWVSVRSIIIASALGFIIPIASSVFPISAALGTSLHDALDNTRSKTQAIKYHLERDSDGGVHWPTVIIGGAGAAFGFSIYYFMPLALLSFNLTLLLYLFFGILMSMLFGLVILSLNLETVVERALTFTFFWWENAAVRDMVTKNLVSHRMRNRKTTIMFCLSLAFIIFISVSFDVQSASFRYESISRFGTRINLIPNNQMAITNNLEKIENLLNDRKSLPYVTGFTYMSFDLRSTSKLTSTFLSPGGRLKRASQTVRGIPPNFYKVLSPQFLAPTNVRKETGWDLAEQLYTPLGSSTIIVGSLYESSMDMKLNSTVEISMLTSPREIHRVIMKPLAFVSTSPGVNFSSFPISNNIPGFQQDALVSLPTYLRLSRQTANPLYSVSTIPLQRVFISTIDDISDEQITDLRNKVSRLGTPVTFADVEDRLRLLNIAIQVMFFFFIFTTIVAMFMCFFSLAASMYSNIYEQAKEIGVLRAIGARKFAIIRIFVYESFILILSSGFLGMVIGIIIAYTMVIQRTLFTQLAIPFVFPWQVVLTIFVLAILFSILSSIFPVANLMTLSIVEIMRRLTT